MASNISHLMSFGILIALDFNEDKFMFVFFRCIMIKGSEQEGTFSMEDLV